MDCTWPSYYYCVAAWVAFSENKLWLLPYRLRNPQASLVRVHSFRSVCIDLACQHLLQMSHVGTQVIWMGNVLKRALQQLFLRVAEDAKDGDDDNKIVIIYFG